MPDQSTGDLSETLPGWLLPFYENPGLTLGSLIAASLIWFYIRGKVEDVLVVPARLNLSVEGVAKENYVITGKRLNDDLVRDEIQIRLRGPKSRLDQIKQQESLVVSKTIAVTEEMNLDEPVPVDITEKDLKMENQNENQNLPFGIHMTAVSLQLEVNIQREVTRTRRIAREDLDSNRRIFTRGTPASDYRIEEIVPQVQSVEVLGPRNQLEELEVVPKSPIDVSGRATDVTEQVELTTIPSSRHISLSVENVAITVRIVSKLTEKEIEKTFKVASDPQLSDYLQQRNWAFEPSDRMLTMTFRLPKSLENQFAAEHVTPILILPPEEIQAIETPTRPHTVSTEDFILAILDQSLENRERITRTKIEPSTIKFVPAEANE